MYGAVLLENRGALVWRIDLMEAYFKMEELELEFYAQLLYLTQIMDGTQESPKNQVERLVDLRRGMDLPEIHQA